MHIMLITIFDLVLPVSFQHYPQGCQRRCSLKRGVFYCTTFGPDQSTKLQKIRPMSLTARTLICYFFGQHPNKLLKLASTVRQRSPDPETRNQERVKQQKIARGSRPAENPLLPVPYRLSPVAPPAAFQHRHHQQNLLHRHHANIVITSRTCYIDINRTTTQPCCEKKRKTTCR